jgi:hypothetical protein
VIASLKTHTEIWSAAHDAAYDAAPARDAAWKVICDLVQSEDWNEAWNEARIAVWSAAQNSYWNEAWNTAQNSAWSAILALFAYDNSAKYLSMTSEELKVWAYLSEHPAAVLLLPAVVAFEQIKELEELETV